MTGRNDQPSGGVEKDGINNGSNGSDGGMRRDEDR